VTNILHSFRSIFRKKTKLEKSLGEILSFSPGNLHLYELALTHKSVSYTVKGVEGNNERLEYLGDAILDAIISDFLYKKYPDAHEGVLTKVRSNIVNGKKLAEIARKIRLDVHINSKVTEGGKGKILEDAFEAFIGAVYLDKGYKATQRFILKQIVSKHLDIEALLVHDTNFKSKLIEWAQKNRFEVEYYTDYEDYNKKYFYSCLRVNSQTVGEGRGLSKKQAEQQAAKSALLEIDKNNGKLWLKK